MAIAVAVWLSVAPAPSPADGATGTGLDRAFVDVALVDPVPSDPGGLLERPLADVALVDAGRAGPQTLEVTALDPTGNQTITRISVMVGLDIRQLPWPAIAAVAVLVAVFVGSIRGNQRAPSVAVATVVSDDEHVAEIEDLGESSIGPVADDLDQGQRSRARRLASRSRDIVSGPSDAASAGTGRTDGVVGTAVWAGLTGGAAVTCVSDPGVVEASG